MIARNKVLAVVHHAPKDTGRVGEILAERGFDCEVRSPVKGDDLPASLAGVAGVVIFGGTMSALDDHVAGIRRELDWIPQVVRAGVPLLGCCLGGQLIARALGGRVHKQPVGRWEFGYRPVRATASGGHVFDRPKQFFFSWHEDGFDLPAGADLLATGEADFPNQAFQFGRTTFAVQFHPEASSKLFSQWLDSSPGFESLPGAHSREQVMADAARYEHDADRWLANFLALWRDSGETPAEAGTG